MTRYEIENVKQMLEVVNENNIQNFLEDLGLWLNLRNQVKKMLKEHPEIKIEVKDVFVWLDDGKHDTNLTIDIQSKGVADKATEK